MTIWQNYHHALAGLEATGKLRRPTVPADCTHNAHMYYVLLDSLAKRTEVIARLKLSGINSVFHYVPLHSSPAGMKYGRASGQLPNTVALADRLVRLPIWLGMGDGQDQVISELTKALA